MSNRLNELKFNMKFYDFENIIEKIEMEYITKDFRRLTSKSSSGNTSESESSEADYRSIQRLSKPIVSRTQVNGNTSESESSEADCGNIQGFSMPIVSRTKVKGSSKCCCELFKLENVHSSEYESEFSKNFKCPKKLKKELRAVSKSQKTSNIVETTDL